MGWIKREADRHWCKRPGYSTTIHVGDVWQCDECKISWEVTGFDSGMQWDPITTVIRWKRYVQDNGIYAPGTK